jgi:predicted Rdx family selenoprotein
VAAEIVPGERGVFDVVADGETIFSKHQSHRFPAAAEIVADLKARMG